MGYTQKIRFVGETAKEELWTRPPGWSQLVAVSLGHIVILLVCDPVSVLFKTIACSVIVVDQ